MQTSTFDITKYQRKLGKALVIFNNKHHVDVFFSQQGWEPHARYQKKKTTKGTFLTQISGPTVPTHIFKQVLQEVTQ